MEFNQLLALLGDVPVFESAFLLAGNISPENVHLQLTRWTKSRKIIRLRRGLYVVAPPYQKSRPHPFTIANLLQPASYVSLQSALAFYGLIPDIVHATLSVSTGRPERRETPLGIFEFRHVRPEYLRGYRMTELGNSRPRQQALVATPEKALLDLVYLQPGGELPAYLGELRLQNLERFDMAELHRLAGTFHSPKLHRAVDVIEHMKPVEAGEFEPL